jgi:hypothetical protein
MRLANMGNTFHALVPPDERSPRLSLSSSAIDASTGNVRYLCSNSSLLRGHPIWRQNGFWEAALDHGVSAQLRGWTAEPVLWDELAPEALREAVVGVHNIVFGQLATISFTMREIGIGREEVEERVLSMCRREELCEDQENELVRLLRD